MEIILKKIEEVIPYEKNPRNNENAIDTVANSIREFGFNNPILVDENMVIVAGHTRHKAAQKLGMTEVPVSIIKDLTEEQLKAFRVIENKASEYAEWDYVKLLEEIKDIKELTGLTDVEEITGFSQEMLEEIENTYNFDIEEPDEYKEDNDKIDALPEIPFTQLGDVWVLGGKHRVMCGSSTEQGDINKLMDGKQADALLTDPPYNVAYENSDGLAIKNDNMSNDSFYKFLLDFYTCAKTAIKDGAGIYIYYATVESINFKKALKNAGLTLINNCMWVKDRLVLGRSDYHWQHEPCLYAGKNTNTPRWYGGAGETTIWEFKRPNANKEHPTMKPVPLFQYNMTNSTKIGDIVLDTFGGSGTTLIAAVEADRIAYCMEFDPKFVDVIINRYRNHPKTDAEDIKLIREGKEYSITELDF